MQHVIIGFVGGLVAFSHCVGMCGGFMLHLTGGPGGRTAITRPMAWLAGKTFTYAFLGALAGFAGAKAQTFLQHTYLQNAISYASGVLILLSGLSLLGLFPYKKADHGISSGIFTSLCRPFLHDPSSAGAFALGMFTGILPCPIVIGFLAYSMQTGSVTAGITTMAAFGAGTAVPLAIVGGAGHFAGARLRNWSGKTGGVILVLVGIITVLRGTEIYHHLLGCPTPPSSQQTAEGSGGSCCSKKSHAGSRGN